MKVSVVIPSRLQVNPNMADDDHDDDPTLWLDRAITGVHMQTVCPDAEVIVSVDHGPTGGRAHLSPRFVRPWWKPWRRRTGIRMVQGPALGQAAAVNRGVEASSGDVLALCEDDDMWEQRKLEAQLALLEEYDLVTCTQREHDEQGGYVRVNSFATPTTWVLKRSTWNRVGGMDETYRYHVDTEWLCRANALGLKRIHITDVNADIAKDPWLGHIQRFSDIAHVGNDRPLVNRTVNPEGGMAAIERGMSHAASVIARLLPGAHEPPMLMNMIHDDATWALPDVTPEDLAKVEPARISMKEHRRMWEKWGGGTGW